MPPSNSAIQLSYQVCPIILSGGIAGQAPDGMLPILTLFSGTGYNALGLPYNIDDLDDAYGAFNVLPGGTLISQQIAKYPFANQYVAANATIVEPLTISVIMDAPMRGPYAWELKRMIMTSLQATLAKHNNMGGLYIVATPAYLYTNLIMSALTDNSRGNNSLPQNAWRFDFERPLVALSDLQGAYNQTMNKVNNQVPTTANLSGIQPGLSTAQSPLSLSPYTQVDASIAADYPSTLGTATNYMNYPAVANSGTFPFNGIS